MSAFYIFLVHTFTSKKSFVNPRLCSSTATFAICMFFIFIVGVTYLASLALMTPYLQTLMQYPVMTAGIVMGPRGLGTMVCMFIVGKLIGKVDTRILIVLGLGLTAWAMWQMTGWTPAGLAVDDRLGRLRAGRRSRLSSSCRSRRLRSRHFPAQMRGDGTGLYNLSRNVGSSVGISVVTALISENVQINHANIAAYVTPLNPAFNNAGRDACLSIPIRRWDVRALDSVISLQSEVIAYIDDFKFLMILSLGVIPLVFLLKKSAKPAAIDHSAVME